VLKGQFAIEIFRKVTGAQTKGKNMLSKKRILRLAAKYGPFVRFYPEGSEGSEDDEAKKKAEAEQRPTQEKPERSCPRPRASLIPPARRMSLSRINLPRPRPGRSRPALRMSSLTSPNTREPIWLW
jgi:hypothetical protein